MKKLTLQLRSKEQAVTIIERTLLELLQTLDTTQKDSGRSYIKIVLSKDQSIIIKMLDPYEGQHGFILYAYFFSKNETIFPVFGSLVSMSTIESVSKSLATITVDFSHKLEVKSVDIECNLEETDSIKFFTMDFTVYDNDTIANSILHSLNKYNDCMALKIYCHINIGFPEEVSFEYTLKIQHSNIFSEDRYSILTKDTSGDVEEYYALTGKNAREVIMDTLNIGRKLISIVRPDKHEVGKIILLQLTEENYNV